MANKRYHNTPRYKQGRAWIQTHANANPNTLCQQCGKTRANHPPHKNGQPQHWQAGHSINGSHTWTLWTNLEQLAPKGDWLRAEMSRCNISNGNTTRHGNALNL